MQLVKVELPSDEKEFDGQTLHIAGPVDGLYIPATHAVHAPPAGPEEPALQMQLVKVELPTGELEFVGQAMHCCGPVDALYFPASHGAHVLPSGPE